MKIPCKYKVFATLTLLSLLSACGGNVDVPVVQLPRSAAQVVAFAAPSSSSFTLLYEDNFDGTSLDTGDWVYRETGLYAGGYNRRQNVSVSGGLLHIAFKKEDINGDGVANEYTGGGIITAQNFGYGYYEARVKLAGGVNGFHQSFWQMGLPFGDGAAPGYDALINSGVLPYFNRTIEIDGFEQNSNNAGYAASNGHYYLPAVSHIGAQSHSVDTTSWFVMGYEWLPGQVKFYVNGNLVRTMSFSTLYGQSNFWLSGLANSKYSGTLGNVPAGTEMQVDYFRFYASNQIGVNRITNGGFEYNNSSMDLNYPMGWLEYAATDSSKVFKDATYARTGAAVLWHTNTSSNYTVTTKQNVESIPNGTYKLTAWIKSSGGQTSALMRVLNHGGTEMITSIPTSAGWTQITIDDISVTSNKALIAFSSVALAGQWIKVDDVVFAQK